MQISPLPWGGGGTHSQSPTCSDGRIGPMLDSWVISVIIMASLSLQVACRSIELGGGGETATVLIDRFIYALRERKTAMRKLTS